MLMCIENLTLSLSKLLPGVALTSTPQQQSMFSSHAATGNVLTSTEELKTSMTVELYSELAVSMSRIESHNQTSTSLESLETTPDQVNALMIGSTSLSLRPHFQVTQGPTPTLHLPPNVGPKLISLKKCFFRSFFFIKMN